MPRSEYRSDYSPPRRGGTRVAEYEDDIEIRERRERRGPRERDYLRDAYERADDRGGTLVVREEIDERGTRGGRKDRERIEEEEVTISRSGGGRRDRPRRREVIEEEEDIRIRDRDRDRDVSVSERIVLEDEAKPRRRERPIDRREEIREEVVYRPRRERPYEREQITEEWVHVPRGERPPVVREVEEWRFEPKRRSRSSNFESITIRERDKERPRESYREEDISIREREREPARGYRDEEIRIRERDGPREEDISIRERERESARGYVEEEIKIRERDGPREEDISIREREREPARGYREEEIRIRERDRPREEEISIRERERDRGSDLRDEEIRITERDRKGTRYRDEEIRIRERDRESEWRDRTQVSDRDDGRGSNSPDNTRREHRDSFKEEVIIKREERDGPGGRMDELVIRRKERSPSPEPIPVPAPAPPEPEPIRAPPIHQEIITHHRHIDHGYEPYRPPVSAPPRIRTPSPPSPASPVRSTYEEIAIRHRDRDGRHEDDIVIKTKESRDDARPVASRRRSLSVDAISRRAPPQIDDEADYYARKTAERAYIGEAHNGAVEDWAIVDVPPGTNRVVMDGVGGASEEITWQRYNGVRRSRFVPESEPGPEKRREVEIRDRRRYVGDRPKTDTMWTEITKDLVIKEAIEGYGYDYEETEWFFYVMEYLRYEDVRRLVQASDDIRDRRRERIKQIEWESQMPREPERLPLRPIYAERPWDEERERIVEREWYDRRPPRSVIMPGPLSSPRLIEKDKIVVIRNER